MLQTNEVCRVSGSNPAIHKGDDMLTWALVFLIVAIIAAVFGFSGIAAASAAIAKILFIIFLVLFVLSLIFGLVRRPPSV